MKTCPSSITSNFQFTHDCLFFVRFGFLLYLTEEDAANAVKNMNGHRIHNKPVTLNFARDRKHSENVASIYAGNLSYKTDKDALQGAFNNAVDAHIAVDGIKPKG